jgi:hypothetical protein
MMTIKYGLQLFFFELTENDGQNFLAGIVHIGIFIFDGGNKRLKNVTKLYCQCQISQKRRKKECFGKFKFALNRLKK